MLNILIDIPLFEAKHQALAALPGVHVQVTADAATHSRELPTKTIEQVDALCCTFLPANHQEMRQLKYVQIASSGYTQLIHQGLPERNIQACNALGVFDIPIAEWNIAMMINLIRDVPGMLRNQAHQVWDRSARFQNEIRGKTVGIWGYGGIGRETARLAKALGMNVYVMTRSKPGPRENTYVVAGTGDPAGNLPDKYFALDQKADFLKELDFLIMAIPQTPATTGVVDAATLNLLPPTAYLLNPARGPLVEEQSLIQALRKKSIAGAALDTHYYYPMPADHPFWTMENVLMTPHISGSSESPFFLERIWDIFLQNIQRLTAQQPLLNELTPNALNGQ